MRTDASCLAQWLIGVALFVSGCGSGQVGDNPRPDSAVSHDGAVQTDGGSTPRSDSGTNGKRIFVAGDLPDYQWRQLPAERVPWNRISALNIGMLWPMPSGNTFTLGQSNWETRLPAQIAASWSDAAKRYTAEGRAAGVKVVCLLGGAGGNPNPTGERGRDYFAAATDTDEHARAFAENIKMVLQGMQFDGVNLDWEDGSANAQIMQAGLVRLAHQLRLAWPEAYIVIPASPTGDDAAGLAPAKDDVDAFEPMTYMDVDGNWGGWEIPYPLTPLRGESYSVERTLGRWTVAGVPASKILLGVAGYGAIWTDQSGDHRVPNTPLAGMDNVDGEHASYAGDNYVTQAWLNRTLAAYPQFSEGWHEATKTSFWGAPSRTTPVRIPDPRGGAGTVEAGLIFYETPRSIQAKISFAQQHDMKGLSFWTIAELIDGERSPILEAIQ
ncbi:MAG: glycoside hydrolase family 18 protein [Deltaproteobacteria bacterium]|nr:glycoside hydrolase family 18 protein [Deltaproteobacteria bacterium]